MKDVLENSIVVNEVTNRDDTNGGYVLLGLAENDDNYVIVRSIVNKKTWKLEDYNELYAIAKKSIKKEDAGFSKPPHYSLKKGGYGTSSTITIASFLEFVNSQKIGNSVLPLDVVNKLGAQRLNDPNITSHLRYMERDYPIDADVEQTVNDAYSKPKGSMHILSDITAEQNKTINRLANQTSNDAYRGKYEGGKHRYSDTAIRHIIAEHGDFLREGLRAQLPMTLTDIARHLSAIKDNKRPSSVTPSRTAQGNPSIITSYAVNGYTLYAEEITKSLGKNLPSDLIGHTMYKAPTLSTAAALATSARTLPRRQSTVLCEYYRPNSTNLSTSNFIADKNGDPALLRFLSQNNTPKSDQLVGSLIALSSSEKNFTDTYGCGYKQSTNRKKQA